MTNYQKWRLRFVSRERIEHLGQGSVLTSGHPLTSMCVNRCDAADERRYLTRTHVSLVKPNLVIVLNNLVIFVALVVMIVVVVGVATA
jgi:hypothetical protein